MTRSNVAQRLSLAVARAFGVDITVIPLWLGHENPSTTHMNVEADLSMKERALQSFSLLARKARGIGLLIDICNSLPLSDELCAAKNYSQLRLQSRSSAARNITVHNPELNIIAIMTRFA